MNARAWHQETRRTILPMWTMCGTGTHKSFVKLSFETMTPFLQSQLSTAAKTIQVGEPSQKKKTASQINTYYIISKQQFHDKSS